MYIYIYNYCSLLFILLCLIAQLSILTLNIQGSQNSLKRFQIIYFVQITGKQINCLQGHTYSGER